MASDGADDDHFGSAVAMDINVIVIGAEQHSGNGKIFKNVLFVM